MVILDNNTIRDALTIWRLNKKQVIKMLGEISNWDVSNITNMSYLFDDYEDFNKDISK